jgi:hypothetical protein
VQKSQEKNENKGNVIKLKTVMGSFDRGSGRWERKLQYKGSGGNDVDTLAIISSLPKIGIKGKREAG